jgi:pre-mRNA-processing factor 17
LIRSIGIPSLGFCLGTTPRSDDVMVGCNDAKIYQYDTRTGQLNIVYERHLSAVNSITFFDGGRRFISSSDDKTLRYWEYGTPVEIKVTQKTSKEL